MKLLKTVLTFLSSLKDKFSKLPVIGRIVVIVLIAGAGWFIIPKLTAGKTQKTQYQTTIVEKGTLVASISASGEISTANSATVSTQASGVVNKLYVENGQKVNSGDPIAGVDLDMTGQQRSSQAWASYQGAKNSLDSARAGLYTSQADLFNNWKSFMDLSQNSTYQNSDGSSNNQNREQAQFIISNDQWLASEAKYKVQQNAIAQAQTSLNSAWDSYQQVSPVIYAPISGTVNGLSLQIGSVITAQSNTSGTSTSQKIASILTDATPTVTVNLNETDAPNVKIGDKVTITVDAFSGKTYTGKVISVDTVGTVSSNVTTYPAVIKLDNMSPELFTNMSAEANIITNVKDNVLLVPVAAVQSQNGSPYVRVLKNGNVTQVPVEVGISSDTQTEITSGVNEGDTVVTSVTSQSSSTTGSNSSPFGGFGGGRAVFGGR